MGIVVYCCLLFCIMCIVVYWCVLLCIAVYCCVLLCIVLYCCLYLLYCCVLLFIFVLLLCIVVYICYIVVHCCILLLGQKNKLGLSLSRKKEFFGPKIGEKIENEVQKLTNFKEKR